MPSGGKGEVGDMEKQRTMFDQNLLEVQIGWVTTRGESGIAMLVVGQLKTVAGSISGRAVLGGATQAKRWALEV